jgi:hypothetical protein
MREKARDERKRSETGDDVVIRHALHLERERRGDVHHQCGALFKGLDEVMLDKLWQLW